MSADREAAIREFLRRAEYFDSEDGADEYVEVVAALDGLLAELVSECVLQAERDEAREREAKLREALRAIQANAEAWHGPVSEDNRHAAALAVIARWARDPGTIPQGVLEGVRALADGEGES